MYLLISFFIFMQKNCCSDSGLGRWFCPSISGVVAGLIMIAAGSMKFLGGKAMLTGVGGMALSVVGVSGHGQIALALTRLLSADGTIVRSLIRNPGQRFFAAEKFQRLA